MKLMMTLQILKIGGYACRFGCYVLVLSYDKIIVRLTKIAFFLPSKLCEINLNIWSNILYSVKKGLLPNSFAFFYIEKAMRSEERT